VTYAADIYGPGPDGGLYWGRVVFEVTAAGELSDTISPYAVRASGPDPNRWAGRVTFGGEQIVQLRSCDSFEELRRQAVLTVERHRAGDMTPDAAVIA
jgi:hypothetical protein